MEKLSDRMILNVGRGYLGVSVGKGDAPTPKLDIISREGSESSKDSFLPFQGQGQLYLIAGG